MCVSMLGRSTECLSCNAVKSNIRESPQLSGLQLSSASICGEKYVTCDSDDACVPAFFFHYYYISFKHTATDWYLVWLCHCSSPSVSHAPRQWGSALFPSDSEAIQTSVSSVAGFTWCQRTEKRSKVLLTIHVLIQFIVSSTWLLAL